MAGNLTTGAPAHAQSSLPSLPAHLQSDTHLTAHLASRYELQEILSYSRPLVFHISPLSFVTAFLLIQCVLSIVQFSCWPPYRPSLLSGIDRLKYLYLGRQGS